MQNRAETVLTALGYTPREAAFLRMVAVHSGVFLRRQYITFTGVPLGRVPQALIAKLVGRRHGKAIAMGDGKQVYHVTYTPIYRALGIEDSTNRKEPSEAVMKSRLMALDFILAHASFHYLESEAEKIAFFTRHFGATEEQLPAPPYRVRSRLRELCSRYFVEKFPVFVVEPGTGPIKPVVGFSFVDDGQVTASSFTNFLSRYRPLVSLIPRLRLFYITAMETKLAPASSQFDRHWAAARRAGGPELPEAMLRYFDLKEAWEGNKTRFSAEEFAEFVRLHRTYDKPEIEAIYQKLKGTTHPPSQTIPANSEVQFIPWLLPDEYRVFGERRQRPTSSSPSAGNELNASPAGGGLGGESALQSAPQSASESAVYELEAIAQSALNPDSAVAPRAVLSVMQALPHAGNDPTFSGGLRAEPEVPARRKRA